MNYLNPYVFFVKGEGGLFGGGGGEPPVDRDDGAFRVVRRDFAGESAFLKGEERPPCEEDARGLFGVFSRLSFTPSEGFS